MWNWLTTSPGAANPIDDALHIHAHIQSLPDTAAVFAPAKIDIVNRQRIDRLLALNDSWLIPSHVAGGNDRMKAVNPNYPHVRKYADAAVKCRCGAVLSARPTDCQLDGPCNVLWHTEALSTLWKRRRDVIAQGAELLRSPDYVARRMDCEPSTVSYISGRLRVDRNRIMEESRRELGPVLEELRTEYTAVELSNVLNRSPETIRRWW